MEGDTVRQRKVKAALDSDTREKQLVNLAVNLAAKQLEDGTASSQVITHFLKIASSRETLEREILARQKDLVSAKTESLHANKETEEAYNNAVDAMRSYSPTRDDEV